jgi:hypothetical protein
MSVLRPPGAATWLLQHLGSDNGPLAGDLLEEFSEGRTAHWYWRQVMTAIFMDIPRQIWAHRTLGRRGCVLAWQQHPGSGRQRDALH